MKTKRILALILCVAMLFCAFVMPTNATETAVDEDTVIIIENENISEETKAKIIAYYTNGEDHNNDSATYGLTCTLLGHKLESSRVYKITHKARTTSPRCLKKTYDYDTCTRCDYENSTLLTSIYIVCC